MLLYPFNFLYQKGTFGKTESIFPVGTEGKAEGEQNSLSDMDPMFPR